MITELRVRGFKCLRDVKLVLSPFTVLIGKNDTGKSSVLGALALLGRMATETLGQVFLGPRGLADFRSLAFSGQEHPRIDLEASVSRGPPLGLGLGARYGIRLAADDSSIRIEEETVELDPLVVPKTVRVAGELFTVHEPELSTDTDRAGPDASKGQQQIRLSEQEALTRFLLNRKAKYPTLGTILGSAFSIGGPYRFSLGALSAPSKLLQSPDERMGEDGSRLPAVLDAIRDDDATFRRIKDGLRAIAPGVQEIQLPPFEGGKELKFKLAGSGFVVPAAHVSEGILHVLAMLTLVYGPGTRSMLLLEEPENAVHPRQLEKIVQHLRHLTAADRPGGPVQVVAATHSPYFLDFVEAQEVVALGRKASGDTIAVQLSELPGVSERLADGMTLGELWYNVGEDLLFGDLLK